jgi:hypothetical protein
MTKPISERGVVKHSVLEEASEWRKNEDPYSPHALVL